VTTPRKRLPAGARALATALPLATAAELVLRDGAWLHVAVLFVGVALTAAVLLCRTRPLLAVASGFGAVTAVDVVALAAGRPPVMV